MPWDEVSHGYRSLAYTTQSMHRPMFLPHIPQVCRISASANSLQRTLDVLETHEASTLPDYKAELASLLDYLTS